MPRLLTVGRAKLVGTASLGVSSALVLGIGVVTYQAQADDASFSATPKLAGFASTAAAGATLLAKAAVWVRIEDKQGNMLVAETFKAGEQYRIPDRDDLVIDARDGGRLVYRVDGAELGQLGNDGEILLGRPLNRRSLVRPPDQP